MDSVSQEWFVGIRARHEPGLLKPSVEKICNHLCACFNPQAVVKVNEINFDTFDLKIKIDPMDQETRERVEKITLESHIRLLFDENLADEIEKKVKEKVSMARVS